MIGSLWFWKMWIWQLPKPMSLKSPSSAIPTRKATRSLFTERNPPCNRAVPFKNFFKKLLTNFRKYATITMSKDERKKGRKTTMKTLDIVTLYGKYYLTTRYNGRAMNREYFKTKTALNVRVKALKAEGYTLAK